MAKHVRTTEWQYDFHAEWTKWKARLSQEDLERLDVSKARAERIAKVTGRNPDEVQNELYQDYYAIRNEFEQSMEGQRGDNEQHLLIRNNMLDSICTVYQKADRILTNLPVEVYLNESDEPAPAWNDGKNVTFNASLISELSEDTICSLHGLNYHEVAHLMFTPRIGSVLGKWLVEKETITHTTNHVMSDGTVIDHAWSEEQPKNPLRSVAFNMLEDCRAEHLLTLKYESVRPFLVATMGEYLLKHPEQVEDSFLLLAGRKYFSLMARKMSAVNFIAKHGEDKAREVYAITTEYRSLVFPRDYNRAMELIEQFTKLIPESMSTPNGCEGRPVMRNGKPVGEKEQQSLQEGDGQSEGNDLSDLLGDQEPKQTLGWSEGGEDVETPESGTKQFNLDKDQTLAEQLEQAVKRAKSDKNLVRKVQDTTKAIVKDGSSKPILGRATSTAETPTAFDVTASRLFGQELERIRIDSDPAWNLEKPTGKLNVRRAMNADVNEINKLFDRWETGNDDYDIEACILIDRSGSMYHEIGSACRSAWVIKRAIEKINGKVSVMAFSDNSKILYTSDERATADAIKVTGSNGGTDPHYALKETQRVFSQSTAKTKLMFLLTDGGFSNHNDKTIEELKRDGVYTSVVFLGSDYYVEQINKDEQAREQYAHGAHDFRAIVKPSDLVKVAKDVVRHTVKGGAK